MTKPSRHTPAPALNTRRKGAYQTRDTITRVDGNEPQGDPGFSWIWWVAITVSVILSIFTLAKNC
jgi:hypothetical protein